MYLQSDAAIQEKELECQQECGNKTFIKFSDLQQYYRYTFDKCKVGVLTQITNENILANLMLNTNTSLPVSCNIREILCREVV